MRTFLVLALALGCGGSGRFRYEGTFADTRGYGCGTGSVPDVQQAVVITEIDTKTVRMQSPDCTITYVTTGSTDETAVRGAGFDPTEAVCPGFTYKWSGLLFTDNDAGVPHMETRIGVNDASDAGCQIYLRGDKVH